MIKLVNRLEILILCCLRWWTAPRWQILFVHLLAVKFVSFIYSLRCRACACAHKCAYACGKGLSLPRWLKMEAVVCFYSPFFPFSSPSLPPREDDRVLYHPLINSAEINSTEKPNKQRKGEIFLLRMDLASTPPFPGFLIPCPNGDERECRTKE